MIVYFRVQDVEVLCDEIDLATLMQAKLKQLPSTKYQASNGLSSITSRSAGCVQRNRLFIHFRR